MNNLTVIVAVYNTMQYLPRCLDSIFNQSYRDFDIFLIDDCSTDDSGKICEEYKEKNSERNVTVLHNNVNLGVSATWEKAVCHVQTEWIYVVDSDDLIHPDLLKWAMEFVMSPMGEKTDILEVGELCLNDKEVEQYSWSNIERPRFMIKCGNLSVKEKAEITGGLGFSKRLLRKNLCLSINYLEYKKKWPRRFFNDGLYSVLLYQKAQVIALLEDIVYIHRMRINSTGRVLDRFDHLRDWIESDEEMYHILRNSGEVEMSIQILGGILNSITKLVYFIDKNHADENEIRKRMLCSFKKYHRCLCKEKKFYKCNSVAQKISWKVFDFSSHLWVKTIGYIYFEHARDICLK